MIRAARLAGKRDKFSVSWRKLCVPECLSLSSQQYYSWWINCPNTGLFHTLWTAHKTVTALTLVQRVYLYHHHHQKRLTCSQFSFWTILLLYSSISTSLKCTKFRTMFLKIFLYKQSGMLQNKNSCDEKSVLHQGGEWVKHAAKEPIQVFNAAHARLSVSSGPHPCFPLFEMVMGVIGAHQPLYVHLFKRPVDFSGVKMIHLAPDSSLEVWRALHGTLYVSHTILVNLFEFYKWYNLFCPTKTIAL